MLSERLEQWKQEFREEGMREGVLTENNSLFYAC